ncbi:MAG TPA: hypothetical protein VHB45_09065 [Alloacidobacterium sp.]|nr:hypothetical protein [Alloacidobacterium sp.]
MNWLRTRESYLPQLALVLFGLAVAVFAWGLQYKLSLYDPPQAISHSMPEAKLLTKEEQVTRTESPLLDDSGAALKNIHIVLSSIFLLISLALNLLGAASDRTLVHFHQMPLRVRLFACMDAFFFRPPPALA